MAKKEILRTWTLAQFIQMGGHPENWRYYGTTIGKTYGQWKVWGIDKSVPIFFVEKVQ